MTTFLIVFVVSYLYHGLGITVGYHRLLSHRSFKVPLWLEYFLVSGGYLCLEGSPIHWVSTHRIHHRYTDKPGDPHSPLNGFWHSFVGWMYKPIVPLTKAEALTVSPDLYRDRVYRFLEFGHTRWHALVCLIVCLLFRVLLCTFLGPIALVANLLATICPFIGAFLVNSVCHMPQFGYRNTQTLDDSKNVWWVALIALGEGWHNNHHAQPQSARHGWKSLEFDVSWYAILVMKLLGLATKIRLPRDISHPSPASEPVWNVPNVSQVAAKTMGEYLLNQRTDKATETV